MDRTHVRDALVGFLAAIALVAAACGDDTDSADVDTNLVVEADYLDAVRSIGSETDQLIEGVFETGLTNTEGLAFETMLPQLSSTLGEVIALQNDAIARYEALEPPPAFANDHERGIRFLREQIDLWEQQQKAADDRDAPRFVQLDLELQSLTREALTELSAEFLEAFSEGPNAAIATSLGGLSDDDAAYLDAVAAGWDEFGRRVRDFRAALGRSYGSDEQLLAALLDAGAGEAFAAARDVIVEIDPPDGYADAHERLLDYLDETVALDTEIAEAAENGDVVGFEVTDFELRLAGARFVLDVPPALASIFGDIEQLVPPDDLPGGDFGADLWEALRRFRVLALRVDIGSGAFPVVRDETTAAALAAVMPTVIDVTEQSRSEVEALTPPTGFEGGHERLVAYFDEVLALRRSTLDAAREGDLESLRDDGVLGGPAVDRTETVLWCSALADLTDDPIEPITATFFLPVDGPSGTQLCPST